jgi:PmbA protein
MLSPEDAQDRAQTLVQRVLQAGADAADTAFVASASESIQVRLGKLEDVERSEGEHISLRAFIGKRNASIGSTDLGDVALAELAQRAVDMARAAPEDAYAGLAPEELLAGGPWPDLDMIDPNEPRPENLRQMADEAEEAALVISGITNSEGAGASSGSSIFALATSHGFSGVYRTTSHSISATVVAGVGGAMQRDYAWRQA